MFYASVVICTFSLVTLNWQLTTFLAVVSVLQRFAKRSQWFIDLTIKYTQPLNYFKSFRRVYE